MTADTTAGRDLRQACRWYAIGEPDGLHRLLTTADDPAGSRRLLLWLCYDRSRLEKSGGRPAYWCSGFCGLSDPRIAKSWQAAFKCAGSGWEQDCCQWGWRLCRCPLGTPKPVKSVEGLVVETDPVPRWIQAEISPKKSMAFVWYAQEQWDTPGSAARIRSF